MLCEPGRLSFYYVISECELSRLSESRKYWLERLFCETRAKWRMVRIGFYNQVDAGDVKYNNNNCSQKIIMETDLSGAPDKMTETLIKGALISLQGAVEWILPSIDIVLNKDISFKNLNPNNSNLF